jgi:serine protease
LRFALARPLPGRASIPAALAVVALVAVALLPVSRANGGSRLEALGVTKVDFSELEDGYSHFVVAYEGSDTARLGAGTRSLQRLPVPEHADGTIDVDALAGATSAGRVLRLEREPDGDVVAVVDAVPGPGDAPEKPAGGSDVEMHLASGGRADELRAVSGTQDVQLISPGTYAVSSSTGEDAYRALPGVAGVSADVPLGVATSDTYWDLQWGLRNHGMTQNGQVGVVGADIGVEDAWVVSKGAGQVIAVVDSGVELTHPDRDANWWRNDDEACDNGVDDDQNGYVDDCSGWDFINNDRTVSDSGSIDGVTVDNKHAMHVGGIVAAETDNGLGVAGIAPEAKIMPLKVTNASSLWMSDLARAIVYAADNGATVVNASVATSPGVSLSAVAALEAAVQYAESRGVLVVVAAGNATNDNDARAVFPASLPEDNVIAVAASDNVDGQASFSNWGARTVDLHAPGLNIVSTLPTADGGYGGMSGTSMASPMVAGAVALVRSARPDLTAEAVKDLILTQSQPVAAFAGRTVSGRRLDVGRILNPTGARTLDPVTFSFDGFGSARPEEPAAASIRAVVRPEALPAGVAVAYRAMLLTDAGGEAQGVAGAPVSTEAGPATTDDDAAVVLADPAGSASRIMPFGFTLPAGDYSLVAEAYSTVDDSTIGRPWAVFFSVAPADQPAPAPTGPPTTGPVSPGTTPTTRPPAGGTPPDTTPTPTTQPPGGGTPPTTAPPLTPTTRPVSGNPPVTQPPGPPAPGAPTPTTRPPSSPTPTTRPPSAEPPPSPPTTQPPAPPTTSPVRDDAPPTTRPPVTSTTTRPPVTSTTTTAPPAPAPVPPPVLPPPPPPAQNGTLRVDSVTPRFGTTGGGDVLTVNGAGFRGTMYVLFGTLPGSVRILSDTMLSVVTPSHVAGADDVRVSVSGGSSVTMPDAFTFVAPNPTPAPTTPTTRTDPPTTTTSPPPPPVNGGTPPPTPTTRPGGASPTTMPTTTPVPPTTSPTTPPTTVRPTTTTTTRPPPVTTPTRFSFGTSVPSGGLRLRPIVGDSPLSPYPPSTWATQRCRAASCAGLRL